MIFHAPLLRRALGLALAAAALLGAAHAPQPAAQGDQRCFPETGFCISGPIRQYWERNGGLAVFGYPITEQRQETIESSWAGPVQWFERDRLEDHSNEGKGVLAGRLGAQSLELRDVNWQALPAPDVAIEGCRLFPATRQYVCGAFLRYWERNGGLERFGYPLTGLRQETIEGREYTVQYFERRRMELHPENAGPYQVLLGLLGRDVLAATGGAPLPPVAPGDIAGETQQAVLDAAYARVREDYPGLKLAVGLVDVVGDYALAMARPYGYTSLYVHLTRQGDRWVVGARTGALGPEWARRNGFPEQLLNPSDQATVVALHLYQLQSEQGPGLSAYLTRPRVAGDFARLVVVPGAGESLDPPTTFYQRRNGAWRFLTAGTAFPEDQLQQMGVPRELWSYGEGVRGPQ